MTTTRTTHAACSHPSTSAARAACRKANAQGTAPVAPAAGPAELIAYTHPTPRHFRGQRHQTEVHVLVNRLGVTVQAACGNLYNLHEAPHTPDGVRIVTDQLVTCSNCKG